MQNETFRYYLDENGISQPTAKAGDSIVLAVGPEGGFHPEEITLMEKYGFKAMSLGKRRLRSETAAALSVAMTVIPTEA